MKGNSNTIELRVHTSINKQISNSHMKIINIKFRPTTKGGCLLRTINDKLSQR